MTTDLAEERPTGRSIIERVPLVPIGSRRVEATLATMVSVFGVLFALLSVPPFIGRLASGASAVETLIGVIVYGLFALATVTALLHLLPKTVFLFAGLAYLVALAWWPAVSDGAPVTGMPWLFLLAGVPCAYVVIAADRIVALAYIVVVGASIALLRTTPAGGAVPVRTAVFDGVYALVLALALFLVAAAVRRAADGVDKAQSAALGSYADAQIDEATESERVRTDALVHDSVLTTFLSAAAARTPEGETLAARMARNAMNVLSRATVASHVGPKVRVADLLGRVRADAAGIGDRFDFGMRDVREHFVPETVADAIVSAAVQAMTNSVKHAGGPEVERTILVRGTEEGGVRVLITDRGRGFDPRLVASERLGVRVSIIERMNRVGGEVDLRTAPGEGTRFTLSWPAAARTPLGADDAAEVVTA